MSHSTLDRLAVKEKTRREILHKSDLIPPLPDLVVRLLAVINKADTEPQDLEDLVQNDQVLVAKMLAMVNSPFYGLGRAITTIRDAVMVLGFRGVRSLVLATSTARFLQRDYGCYGHDKKGLWLHAACVAAGAKNIARSCHFGQEAAEQLFVVGLLHDIGKLLLAPFPTEKRWAVTGELPAVECERDAVGLDHAEAGALVAAKWNLAQEIQDVIRAHHDDGDGPSSQPVAIVRLADAIAHDLGIGYVDGMAPASDVRSQDLAALGLDASSWAPLRDETAARMAEGVAALSNLSG